MINSLVQKRAGLLLPMFIFGLLLVCSFFVTKFAKTEMTNGQVSVVNNVASTVDADYDFTFSTTSTDPQTSIEISVPGDYDSLIVNGSFGTVTDAIISRNGGDTGAIDVNGNSVAVASVTGDSHRTITVTLASPTNLSGTVQFRILQGITNPAATGVTGTFQLYVGGDLLDNIPGVYISPRVFTGDILITVSNTETSSFVSDVSATIVCQGGVETPINTQADAGGNIYIPVADLGDSSDIGIYGSADCDSNLGEQINITLTKEGFAPNLEQIVLLSYGVLLSNRYTIDLKYAHVISNIVNELGASITPTSVSAGANSTPCVVTEGSAFCPVSIADDNDPSQGFVIQKEGFVTLRVDLAGDRTTNDESQRAVSIDRDTMRFAHKLNVSGLTDELHANTIESVDGVVAGLMQVSCTIQDSFAYCPVGIDDDAGSGFAITKDGYVTNSASELLFSQDRTSADDPQVETDLTGFTGLKFSHKLIVANELGEIINLDPANEYVRYEGAGGNDCTISNGEAFCPIPLANDNTRDLSTAYFVYAFGYVYPDFSTADNPRMVFYGGDDQNRVAHTDEQKLVTMTADNGLEHNHKIIVKDELGNALTPDTVVAGLANRSCIISANTAYCPVPPDEDAGGFTVAKDGYVTSSVNFGFTSGGDPTMPSDIVTMTAENGLDFAVKVRLIESDSSPIDSATVRTGNGLTTVCNAVGLGNSYYCAVPLADTQTQVDITRSGFIPTTTNFTDRTVATNPQREVLGVMARPSSNSGWIYVRTPSAPVAPQLPPVVEADKSEAQIIFEHENPAQFFVTNGSVSSYRLGSGERASVLNSFISAFGRQPDTLRDWEDVLRIVTGQWPLGISKPLEAQSYLAFRSLYGRFADMKNNTEVNVLKMMAYGVRSIGPRNILAEGKAVFRFMSVFKRIPKSNFQWNIVRAIAYGGLK